MNYTTLEDELTKRAEEKQHKKKNICKRKQMLKQRGRQTDKSSGRKAATDAEIVAKAKEERYRENLSIYKLFYL
jgi:hypothetical protein